MDKLRPCPFCGNPTPVWMHTGSSEYVWCPDCDASGPPVDSVGGFTGEAERRWNKRFWETREQAAKWEVANDGTSGTADELRRVERVLKLAQGDGVESGGAAAGQTADEQTHPGESENGVERVEVLHFEPVSHCVVRGRVASVKWGEMRMVEEVESDAN